MKSERLYVSVRVASPFVILGIWELFVRTGIISMIFLPPPSHVILAAVNAFRMEGLTDDLTVSALRLFLGFILGIVLALICSFSMSVSGKARWFLSPFIMLIYPVPKVALYPLLVIWLGTGETSKILLVATGSFFPVVMNTHAALNSVPSSLIRAARNLGANQRKVFLKVAFPWALPAAYAGAVIGAGLSLIMLVYSEMTAAEKGIGYFTYTAATLFQTENAFAGVLVIALLGFAWYQAVVWVQKRHCPWSQEARL